MSKWNWGFLGMLGLVLVFGCQSPAGTPSGSSSGTGPSQGGSADDPIAGSGNPIDAQFDYQASSNLISASLRRSTVLASGTSVGAFKLTFTMTPSNANLNIEQINTAFAFVKADGSLAAATYNGHQVAENLFGNSHAARSVSFSLPHLAVGSSDLYHIGPWQEFTKLRVGIGVMYFQTGPGIPPQFFSKTMDFNLTQDLPAVEGLGYQAFFDVSTFGIHLGQDFLPQGQWRVVAEVTYPDGLLVVSPPTPVNNDSALVVMNGFRPNNGLENWKVKLDATGDGAADLEWDVASGFDINAANFDCFLDESTGLPINP